MFFISVHSEGKVLCFDTLLQLLILKEFEGHRNPRLTRIWPVVVPRRETPSASIYLVPKKKKAGGRSRSQAQFLTEQTVTQRLLFINDNSAC
jgi:hypothetical protein